MTLGIPSVLFFTFLTQINSLSSKITEKRDSLEVQWLRLHASNAGGEGSVPGWGTKIPHATRHGQKNPQKTKQNKPTEKKKKQGVLFLKNYREESGI